jgi:4'-phosphopantetheinyl transferase EntD
LKPQAFFGFPEVPAGKKTLAGRFPDVFREAVAELFSPHRYGAVLLRQDEIAAACPPESWLHQRELRALQSYKLPKRRREFLGGRICAKLALGRHRPELVLPPQQIEIVSAPSGQPLLNLPPVAIPDRLHLSISHGGELVGAVVANGHCGLDLQPIRDNLVRVREKYCLPEEERLLQSSLAALDEQRRLGLLWTAKEAVKKALSYHRMYGFLELELTALRPLAGNCLAVSLDITADKRAGNRSDLRVAAAISDGYGVALCFVDKE